MATGVISVSGILVVDNELGDDAPIVSTRAMDPQIEKELSVNVQPERRGDPVKAMPRTEAHNRANLRARRRRRMRGKRRRLQSLKSIAIKLHGLVL